MELPDDPRNHCVSLAERLKLPVCGIDLRLKPDGERVCFEVNPMPAYAYFEAESGLPISRAIVQFIDGV